LIIYKFTQGNLCAKKNREKPISVASQEKKIANCDIGDRQRGPLILPMSVIIFFSASKNIVFAELMCKQLIFCARAATRLV
jgi:hypothetical protein